MKSIIKQKSGFTMIETVIYIGLFSITVGAILVVAYGILSGTGRLQNKISVREESAFILRKFNWALTGASNISVISPNKLQITKPSLPPSENPLVFTLASNMITLSRGSGPQTVINSTSVPAISLIFASIPSANGNPPGVQIDFSLVNVSASGTFKYINYLKK